MNNKIITSIIILLFATLYAPAQTIKFAPDQDLSKFLEKDATISLDKSYMVVNYSFEVLHDTVSPNTVKSTNIMVLQIGSKQDKYFDLHNAEMRDFLSSEENKKRDPTVVINEAAQMGRGTITDEIYWNYPTKGELSVAAHMIGGFYLYKEDIPQIEWKMGNSTRSVAGYSCKKATCSLFGRNYTAWYAPEIPVSKGPYKFSGLPGLILKVEDDSNQISWTCIGLEKKAEEIFFTERDYFKTGKAQFLKSFNYSKKEPLKLYQAAGMIEKTSMQPKKAKPYNPIERE